MKEWRDRVKAEGGEKWRRYCERRKASRRRMYDKKRKGRYAKCACSPCVNPAVVKRPTPLCQECKDAISAYSKWQDDNPDLAPLTEGNHCRCNHSLRQVGKLLYAGSRAHMEPLIVQHSRRVTRELSLASPCGSTKKGTRGSE